MTQQPAFPFGAAVQVGVGHVFYPEEIQTDGVIVEVYSPQLRFERALEDAELQRLDWGRLGTCEGGSFWLAEDTGWVPITNARIIMVRLKLEPGTASYARYGASVIIWAGRYVNHSADSGGGFTYDLGSLTELMTGAARRTYGDRAKWLGALGERYFGEITAEEIAALKAGDKYDETIGSYLTRFYAPHPEASWGHGPDLVYVESTSPDKAVAVTVDLDTLGLAPVFQGVEVQDAATEWGHQIDAKWKVLEGKRPASEVNLLTPRRFVVSEPDPATNLYVTNQATQQFGLLNEGGSSFSAVVGAGYDALPGTILNLGTDTSGNRYLYTMREFRIGDWIRNSAGVKGGRYEERSGYTEGGTFYPGATHKALGATFRYEVNVLELAHTDAVLMSMGAWIAQNENAPIPLGDYLDTTGAFKGKAIIPRNEQNFLQQLAYFAAFATSKNEIYVMEFNLQKDLLEQFYSAWLGTQDEYYLRVAYCVYIRSARASGNSAQLRVLTEEFQEDRLVKTIPVPAEAKLAFTRDPTYSIDDFPGVPIGPLKVSFTDPHRGRLTQFAAATSVNFSGGTLTASFETVAPRR